MKTRLLIIICIIMASGIVGATIMAEIYLGQLEWKEKVGGLQDTTFDNPDASLQKILEDCTRTAGVFEDGYSLWSNQTHKITAGHCEIRTRVNSGIGLDRTVYSTVYILTEDGDDKLNPHQVVIDLEQTNTVTFVNVSPVPVRIQEVGENKMSDIPKNAWHTKAVEPGKELTMQFNSTGYYEFNVKKITGFLEGYFEHHGTGDIVVLSNNTSSLSVDVRAKMAQSIVSSYFGEHPALHGVGSGGAPGTGVSISIDETELELHEDAELYYYELYQNLIPFDVPITIEFGVPPMLLTG